MAVMLVAMTLVGCGGAEPPQRGSGVERSADPVLVPALAGEQSRAATDPRALARQLTVAETTIRDRAPPPERVAAAGRTAQVAYLALLDRPDWDAAVLAGVPAPLRAAVRGNTAAGRELRAMTTQPPTTVPAWRVVEPLPAPRLRAYYAEAQRRFGVPWSVLAAVHLVESRMGRIVGLSTAGAQGPMQFIAGTWTRYGLGGDVWKSRDAILGAANYLAAKGAADGTDTGLDNALYSYNNDSRYVQAVRDYAALMQADERAFLGFHAWQVYYRTQSGMVLLPAGYESSRTMPVQQWLARQPR
ncbi:MAG: transglycosylase SLT domain-containing protein [Pseudonocardiaceae bacterium]